METAAKKMSTDTISAVVSRLAEHSQKQQHGFAIVLHGGEPLLLGKSRLAFLLSELRAHLSEHKYPIIIQTNGMLIDEDILNLCNQFKVSVSVSIDGARETHEIARFDRKGRSSFNAVVAGINRLRNHTDANFLFAGMLSVIQPHTSPTATYHFLRSLESPSMDFLLQDGNYTKLPFGKISFNSIEYGKWLANLFDIYVSDSNPPKIKIIDDLIKIILGGNAIKEGKGDHSFGILIIETDGEIRKNDTLRAAFDGVDYFKGRPNIKDVSLESVLNSDEFIEYNHSPKPTAEKCKNCDLLSICGGGMPLYRWSKENGFNNPSIYCKDHQFIINHILSFLKTHGIRYA